MSQSRLRVAILDDYQDAARRFADWSLLEDRAEITVFRDTLHDQDALAQRLGPFDVVVATRERTGFPRTLLERLPRLKLIASTAMRNFAIDMEAARQRGVVVCGTTSLGYPAAELTWALILGVARHIAAEDRAMREGRWQSTVGVGLREKTLGVLGLGKLGGQVATVGKAFGMKVVAWSRNLTDARCAEIGAERVEKDALFERADFVTVHLVLSDRTRGLIGAPELGRMKKSAYLVNTSRGPIVDEAALLAALRERRIAGAALDVYDREPLPADHPFRRLDNVLLSPHTGYVTEENYRAFYGECVENIDAFLRGQPKRVLNA